MQTNGIRASWAERFGRTDPKIVCVGLNYRSHADEQDVEAPQAPLLFAKFANTLAADGDTIVLPAGIGHVDAEAELAVVIGREGRDISRKDAFSHIDGWTCANDISARDAQFGDGQWFRGKGYDGFCPIGPQIVPRDELGTSDLRIVQRLNGQTLQDSRTSLLIFPVDELVAYISTVVTLERGDLILTGTPEGVGVFRDPKVALAAGDTVEVEIEGIGTLTNLVSVTE